MDKNSLIDNLVDGHKDIKSAESVKLRFLRWAAISILCSLAGLFTIGLREDWNLLIASPLLLLQNIIILFLVFLSGFSALRLSQPGSLSTTRLKKHIWLPSIAWLLALVIIGLLSGVDLAKAQKISLFSCTKHIFFMGLIPGSSLLILILQGTVLERKAAGFLALLASFGLGAWVVQFTCHNDDPVHVFLWHFFPVLALGGAGALIAKYFIKKI